MMSAKVLYGIGGRLCLDVGDDRYEILRAFHLRGHRAAIVQQFPKRQWEPRLVIERAGGWCFADEPAADPTTWIGESVD